MILSVYYKNDCFVFGVNEEPDGHSLCALVYAPSHAQKPTMNLGGYNLSILGGFGLPPSYRMSRSGLGTVAYSPVALKDYLDALVRLKTRS